MKNACLPQQAENLWAAILAFADASCGVAGEGNSGEFHNPDDAKQFVKDRTDSLQKLIEEFHSLTGYKPKFVGGDDVGFTSWVFNEREWTIDE